MSGRTRIAAAALAALAGWWSVSSSTLAAGGPQAAPATSAAPQDKGADAASQACTQCHALRYVNLQHRSTEQWRDTIFDMISRGAQVKPDEIELIATYLAANFGPESSASGGERGSGGAPGAASAQSAKGAPDSSALYVRNCQICHADGNSTTASLNFADGTWNRGSRVADIANTIANGVAGTNMQGFKDTLSEQEILALARRVRAFDQTLKPE